MLKAALLVKVGQVVFKIDVQPVYPSGLGKPGCLTDQSRANPLSPIGRVNGSVQKKGMNAAIPRYIHESDEVSLVKGAYVE